MLANSPDCSMNYGMLATGITFDILPAIGTHAPMTEPQIAEMYGDLPKATYHVHHWRTGLHHFGEVPSEFVQEVSGGKLDYSIPVAVNHRLVGAGSPSPYELIISVGQVIPHEVIGIANGFKNILVGAGGVEMINKSHFLGAVDGMERLMGTHGYLCEESAELRTRPLPEAARYCVCHERHGCRCLWRTRHARSLRRR